MSAPGIGLVFLLALAAPIGVRAHEGHPHKVMGTVSALTPDSVEVKTSDGGKVAVTLSPDTRYRAGRQPRVAADVKVGGRVVVITEEKDGKVFAREVLLPPVAPGAPPTGGADR